MKIGVQISSFKPVLLTEEQVRTAFRKTKEMGAETVQLQWIDKSVPVPAVARALADAGLMSLSVQDFTTLFREDPEYYYSLNASTGGTWVTVSRIVDYTPQGLADFAALLEQLRDDCAARGMKVCFHPTERDYRPIGDTCAMDYLTEHVPWLSFCLDLYHAEKAGRDLNGMLRRLAGRVCMVHFKDSAFDADGSEHLVPAGTGHIDWTGVAKTCRDTGVEAAFVEQESWEGDPFEALAQALAWLKAELAG